MLSLPASKPQSPHKGSLGISLREDRTETRLMLSLPAAKPHSPHKRSLGIILREEKARLMYDLHVSILQELFVVHLLFSFSWNVSPGFGSEKLGWFGVRGGWRPQCR